MGRGTRALLLLAYGVAIFSTTAAAAAPTTYVPLPRTEEYVQAMGDCETLDACLAALDRVVPATDRGVGLSDDRVRQRLLQFGEPAKQRLLNLAVGPHGGWRNLAGDLLGDWPNLHPNDVPMLRRALELSPNGWPARALGLIGTEEAIDALLSDFKDDDGQTGYGLRRIGPRVLPRLFPLLTEPERLRGAMSIIREMGAPAAVVAPGWAAIALDANRPKNERVAALRGLEALGMNARAVSHRLHPLLEQNDPDIATGAFNALRLARDPIVVAILAEACPRFAEPTERYPTAEDCLLEIALFGLEAHLAAPAVRPYLLSPNSNEQVAAASTLGFIGDTESAELLIAALGSRDWRVTYAAARSLGWLGAAEGREALTDVARNHWLPEVRREAMSALAGLGSPAGHSPRPRGLGLFPFMQSRSDGVAFMPDAYALDSVECPARRWVWAGTEIAMKPEPVGRAPSSVVRFADGSLVATDHGEWGGELAWRPRAGNAVTLRDYNASGVARSGSGAVAAFGLAHMMFNDGYLTRLERRTPTEWTLHDIGTLPGDSSPIETITPGLFAVESVGRLVVFNDHEILGLARCVS